MRLLLFLTFLLFLTPHASAQEPLLPDDLHVYIPADIAGIIALRQDQEMLPTLGAALQTAQVIQPTRVSVGSQIGFGTFFPLQKFDMEQVSWTQLIQPWVGDEIVYVYRELSPTFTVAEDDALLILESTDDFIALQRMSAVLQGQDLLRRTEYREVTIYEGDLTSFAFAPGAVLIGSTAMIELALDAEATAGERLADQALYQSVRRAAPQNAPIFIYLSSESAANGFAALVGGCEISGTLFGALGEALRRFDSRETLESALLSGAVDAVGVSVLIQRGAAASVRAVATVHTTLRTPVDVADAAESVLNLIPRSAAIVQSGADAANSVYIPALGLPLANFVGCALGGFPFSISTGLQVLPLPTAADLVSALTALESALDAVRDFDLRDSLFEQLDGSYALALIPRPNAPTPLLNTPYDLLLVSEVRDGDRALAGVLTLIQSYLPAEAFSEEVVGDVTMTVLKLPNTDRVVLGVAAVGDVLIVGTGAAPRQALAAASGDNRLTGMPRWTALHGERVPMFYADINPIYSTFLAQPGASGRIPAEQIGITTAYLGESLYEIALTMTLPQ